MHQRLIWKTKPFACCCTAISRLSPDKELAYEKVEIILNWAVTQWQRANVPHNNEIQFIQRGDKTVFKAL